ncbi:MAG: motility associated factor glycosyltransferase family protein [Rhodospirillaceae bacterium]|jgi:hypothetical protein|nr:motility associated factor glycosyltransferase family protein [Rhodospirillales bacterium]MBT3906624.1 motility associated factor glycosyltransferase family protein [Rhodospirillaceae bacterium]MBT4699710.1 motility associated factor glycosyltransferase family protein [Rhodospirillaceae bacterium]MBT5033223.1 motility associated factor glycosyltransferase family protein [Rhodospirillaceae bacterium]MBT6219005.1 motility associated factor glycosyltransferase family protein [Rhodospirillaceae 
MVDREELRKNNLEMFEAIYPEIYAALKDYKPISELRIDEDGEPDVWFDGQYYYNNKAAEFAKNQLEKTWALPTRVEINPPQTDGMDDYAGPTLFNILLRADKEDISYHRRIVSDNAFTVVVFGIGLGLHIDEIVERTNCSAIVFADVNYEFLYHSLEVYDWEKLDELITSRNGRIKFVIDTSPDQIGIYARLFIRGSNIGGVDGVSIIMHQKNAILDEAFQKLARDVNLIATSLGFFYDETLMLKNCHVNLCSGESKYYQRPNEMFPADIPVFVVGSGPSLDACLPMIKKNADRAFIISAGTSLRPLVFNGILPDMHLEQENLNVDLTVDQVAEKYDLSSILYVAATTVDPTVTKYFDNIIYYSRASLSPFPIYFDDKASTLERPHNTVVNASFSFAQELGFKDFYFFGVDCGTIDQARHHSKDAYQYTEDALHVDQIFDIPVTSNFGGDFFTSKGLLESLDHLEAAILKKTRGRRYYNCSDGAYIPNTLPILPEKIDLPEFLLSKKDLLQKIYDKMPVYTEEKFSEYWDEKEFENSVDSVMDTISEIFDGVEDVSDNFYQIDLNKVLVFDTGVWPSRMDRGVITLIRGTLFQMIISIAYYTKRITEPEKLPKFTEIVKEEVQVMIEKLREDALKELGSLNKENIAEAGAEASADNALPG